MSLPNMNPETGVRYGVLNPNRLPSGDWFDSFEPFYGEGVEVTEDMETETYILNKDGFKAEYNSNTNTLMVFESPYIVKCRLCSPCYPNAGDLDNRDEEYGYETYDLVER